MTACREFLELISASLDQSLSPEEQARLDSHLAGCPGCGAAQKELRRTHARIKELEAVEPPSWLASKIMAKIRAEAAPQTSFWRRFILPIVMKPQLQVASILLLAATGFYLLKSQRSEQDAFKEMKQQRAPAALQSQPSASVDLGGKLAPQSNIAPSETQKSKSEGLNRFRLEDSKSSELDFAPAPPPSPAPVQSEIPKPEMAKQERDRMRPEPSAAAPPALAGASVNAGVAAVAESEAAPTRQAKKASPAADRPIRADEEAKEKRSKTTGQLMDQTAPKDKSDATAWVIRLDMPDPLRARPLVQRELARAGAIMQPLRDTDDGRVLRASLDSRRVPDLIERLAKLGKVLEQTDMPIEKPTRITLSIRW